MARLPAGYPDAVLLVTDIDDAALAAARRRLGTTTVDDTVNAALRLVAGLPQAEPSRDATSEEDRPVDRLAEDILGH